MAETNLTVQIKAQDQTKAGIDSASGNFDKLKGTALKLGGVLAGAFAVGKIVDFGKASFQAFADSEAAVARIDARLKTMGKSGTDARDSILAAGEAAVKLGFDDEAAAESLTKFFQATNDLTEAQKLNTIAMDIARGKGIELGDAQKMVQMIIAGNTKELKAMGVEVDDGATGMENLTKVSAAYAGQAAAFSETTQGKMEALSATVENFQETLGAGIAEGLAPFMDAMMQIAQDPQFQEFVKTTASLVGTTLLYAFKAVKASIDFLSEAFFKVIQAWDATVKFWNSYVMPVFKAMGDFIQGITDKVNALISAIQNLASKAGSVLSSVGGAIGGAVNAVIPGGKRALGGSVSSGIPYLVGENGPELFMPGTAGFVAPNGGFGGGSGVVVNINGGLFLDEYSADIIGTKIVERLRTQFRF